MHLFSLRSSKKKKTTSIIERIGLSLIFSLFLLHSLHLSSSNAIENNPLSEHDDVFADIVNPYKLSLL